MSAQTRAWYELQAALAAKAISEAFMTYQIRCEVSGGVTGHRVGLLKKRNGEIRIFDTRSEAEQVAASLTETMNGPKAIAAVALKAKFSYTVEEKKS
jgi:hypothetical protein